MNAAEEPVAKMPRLSNLSVPIEVLSSVNEAKWESDGLDIHDRVPVETGLGDTQLWNLNQECELLLWSFHIVKDGKKLYLAYTNDSDEVDLEYEGDTIRFFRIYIVANGGILIRTADKKRCLGMRDGFLSLYAEDALPIEDFIWWIEINRLRLTQFMAEIKNPVTNDAWISRAPVEYHPVPAQFSSEDQYWLITKYGSGNRYESYFEVAAIYKEGGQEKTLHAAYDAHGEDMVTFMHDCHEGDRQFILRASEKGRFKIILRDRNLYATVIKRDGSKKPCVLHFASNERDAVDWEAPMVGVELNDRHLSGPQSQQK